MASSEPPEGPILEALASRLARELSPPAAPLLAFRVAGHAVGCLDPVRAHRLSAFDDVFEVTGDAVELRPAFASPQFRSEAVERVACALAREGLLSAWRDERYPVLTASEGAPLLDLERAAARYFGIRTFAVHVNGTVTTGDATRMWIARRSQAKSIDPGQLDNLVGGGVPLGETPRQALVREAWEEAGLSEDEVLHSRFAGELRIVRHVADGVQDETVLVHDLELPPGRAPCNQDGEVAGFSLVPIAEAARAASGVDAAATATVDASLVIADWLARHGYVAPRSALFAVLDPLRA